MKDTVSLLVDPSPFVSEDERNSQVRIMSSLLLQAPATVMPHLSSFSHKAGYYVEYPLYTSFPEMTVTAERADLWNKPLTVFSVINKTFQGFSSIDIKLSYACVLIVPTIDTTLDTNYAQTAYDTAEDIVNQYIKLYKLLPYVHHHDLSARNNTRSGYIAPIWKYNVHPSVELVDGQALMLNSGPANLLLNHRELNQAQLNLLLSGFNRSDWSEYQDVIYRLIKAYDFNCYGDADSAIIFSSSAIEGFLMATEALIRINEEGLDRDTALRRVKNKSLSELKQSAVTLYGLNTEVTTNRSAYGKWHHRCYKQRNNVIHKQNLYSPLQSRPAIDATSNLILHISRSVRRKYSKSTDLMKIIEAITTGLLLR